MKPVATRPPVRRELKPPSTSYNPSSTLSKSDITFILPESRPEPGSLQTPHKLTPMIDLEFAEVIRVNTAAVPQPFLEPQAIERWR